MTLGKIGITEINSGNHVFYYLLGWLLREKKTYELILMLSRRLGLENEEFHKDLRKSYLEGLVWVLQYYYYGCCSWNWFFPYHYAPLTSGTNIFFWTSFTTVTVDWRILLSTRLGGPFIVRNQVRIGSTIFTFSAAYGRFASAEQGASARSLPGAYD